MRWISNSTVLAWVGNVVPTTFDLSAAMSPGLCQAAQATTRRALERSELIPSARSLPGKANFAGT